jgi:periplasmic protein CpxP/Spy
MKRKITMLFALILIATTGIYAQGMQRRSVPERVKATMDKITTPLNLDASQASRTDSVFTDFYTAQMKMFQDAQASGNRPDRSAYQKLMQDRDAKLQTIFTADQYTKFKNEVEETLRPQRQTHEGNQ